MKFLVSITTVATAVSAGTVSVPVSRRVGETADLQSRHPRDLHVRGSAFQATLSPFTTRYMIDVEVGTPPQLISVILDTGSNDLWFHTSNSRSCGRGLDCGKLYDLSASSTASRVDKAELQGTDVFQLRYNVGDIGANGTYVRDTISIAGATIQNQIIGAAVQSNIQLPILGLGPQAPPGVWDRRNGATYNDVVDTMMMQGVINRRAFSVFLNQASKTSGNVIFGGIDTEKYYDSLVKLSMVPTEKGTEAIVRYGLKLSQVFANGIDNVASLIEPIPALLDTGSPVIMLPAAVIDPIFKHANAITGKDGIAKVDCALARTEKATFEFTFEGKTIVVPFKDAVVDVYDERDQSSLRQSLGSQAKSWERVCFFGFRQGGPDANAILGDPFLRNAYSVFDNDDHSISLAQARFDSTKSNVVEIPANGKLPNIRGRATPKAFDSDTNSGSKEDKKSSAQRKQASVTGAAIVAISAMMVFL